MNYTQDEERLLSQAGMHLNSGKISEAIKIYTSLLKESENQSLLLFRHGLAEYLAGDQVSGIAKMDDAYGVSDSSTFAALYEGAVFHVASLHDYPAAKKLFSAAVSKRPSFDTTEYLIHAIQYCMHNQIDEEALDLSEQFVERHAGDFRSWLYHGIALRHLGFGDRAVASFEKSVELNPQHGEAWEMLTLLAFDNDDHKLFTDAIGKSRALSSKPSLALLLLQVGEFLESASLYKPLAVEFPNEDTFYNLAYCFYGSGSFPEAMEAIEAALQFSPNEQYYLVFKKRIYLGLGDYDAALRVGQNIVKLYPLERESWLELAGVFFWAGDFETSLTHINHAFELSPPSSELLASRANVLRRLGRTEEAIKDCRAALGLNRNCLSTLLATAQTLCNIKIPAKNQIDEARRCVDRLKSSLRLRRDLLAFDVMRSDVAVLEHDKENAKAKEVQASILSDPHAPPWQRKLDTVKLKALTEAT